jgi:hypothetical protein
MPNLIEWLDVISTGTKLDKFIEEDVSPFKDYVPFQINNGLSQSLDTILLANEMNKRPWLSKEMQFAFLDKAVSKKKRYSKWAKVEKLDNQDDIDQVSKYYQINMTRAQEYIKLLSEDALNDIKKYNDVGGCTLPKTRNSKK